MIALIDYGAGNLASVRKALAALGAQVVVPHDPAELAEAGAVIVPGVGHFGATAALDAAWRDAILGVIGEGRPLLGICLGMQWLFEGSTEAPDLSGLGLLSGVCDRLPSAPADWSAPPLKIPHVGWNSLHLRRRSALTEGIDEGAQVYFTHAYASLEIDQAIAVTTYGTTFASVVERGQVAGVQFHPEKSGEVGLRILGNFLARVM